MILLLLYLNANAFSFFLNDLTISKNQIIKTNKILVVYFSCTGNTRRIAKNINSLIGGDLIEIVPKDPYTSADLNYNNQDSRVVKEHNDQTILPEISNDINNINEYSTIFIGYPLWWGQAPNIIRTFMNKYDFSNKNIITFSTSISTSTDSSSTILKELAPTANWDDSFKRFQSSASETAVKEWTDTIINILNPPGDDATQEEASTSPTGGDVGGEEKFSKNLIVYFSCTGNTRRIAKNINSLIGGDLIEIVPKDPYTSADLNYNNQDSRVVKEHNDQTILPEISNDINNINEYSTIFIGYPLWWGQAPNIIRTFMNKYDFSNKNIITFSTSISTSTDSSSTILKELAPTANWDDSFKRFQSSAPKSDVRTWLESLNVHTSILVIYFSATGNTKRVAEFIQSTNLGDIKSIDPVEPYTDADLNWHDENSRVVQEHNNPDLRPSIKEVGDLKQYNIIFLGYPLWWRRAPHVVYTFIENADLSNKKIIPFCTSTADGIGDSGSDLETKTSTSVWLEGARFGERSSEEAVRSWAESIDLNPPKTDDATQDSSGANQEETSTGSSGDDTDDGKNENKILVVYFSCTGNTRRIAKNINSLIGGDLIEIVPKDPYTSADLNYNNQDSRVVKEHNDQTILPEISNDINNINEYSTIFIGYPLWWGQAPNIIRTFMNKYDFSNKNIITFSTSISTSTDSSSTILKELAPTANWDDSFKRFQSSAPKSDVRTWLESLNVHTSILVIYFSATGNTKRVAEFIQSTNLGNIKSIDPVEPYTDADLNWHDENSRVVQEHNNPDLRPSIKEVGDLKQYNIIFLGYPLWWRRAPHVVYTFIENADLSNKKIIPFCTSTADGIGDSGSDLETKTSTSVWLEGARFGERSSEEAVRSWAESIDLNPPKTDDATQDSSGANQEETSTGSSGDDTDDGKNENKILVVYFSCTGNTRRIAKNINSLIGGDLIEIVPKDPYTSADLNYNNQDSRVVKEHNDQTILPEISNDINNINEYSTIFIGYPLWWGQAPNIIRTFMNKYDFSNKNIITFSTSISTSTDSSSTILKELAPTANWDDSFKRFQSSAPKSDVRTWLESLNVHTSILVIYFSATGNTKRVAEFIQSTNLGDIKSIDPVEPYTDADLNWHDENSRVVQEHNNPDLRPSIKEVGDLKQYNIIFLGYPLWWRRAPHVVYTFIENADLSNKKIIPFCTSTADGIGDSGSDLETKTSTSVWLEGARFGERSSEEAVRSWAESIDLNPPKTDDATQDSSGANQEETSTGSSGDDTDDGKNENKILVVYFSCTGNTRRIAKNINSLIGGDLIEIVPKDPYTSADLNYNNQDSRVVKEHNDQTILPEISNDINNINEYSTIFIGYPLWWGQAPNIIRTFMNKYDFSNKNIITFSTSISTSTDSSSTILKELAPTANWDDSFKRFQSSAPKSDVKLWIEGLDLTPIQSPRENNGKKGLKPGEIAGIAIAAVVVAAIIVFVLVYFLVIKKRKINKLISEQENNSANDLDDA